MMQPSPRKNTRASLVRSAERLIAERGLGAVTVKDITREAGARNPSAVHYHFGSVEALIKEVFAQRFSAIETERLKLFAAMEGRTFERPLLALMEAALMPLLATCLEEEGRLYIRFCVQFTSDPRFDVAELVDEVSLESLEIMQTKLVQQLPGLRPSTFEARLRQGFNISLIQASDYARRIEAGTAPPLEEVVRESALSLSAFFSAN